MAVPIERKGFNYSATKVKCSIGKNHMRMRSSLQLRHFCIYLLLRQRLVNCVSHFCGKTNCTPISEGLHSQFMQTACIFLQQGMVQWLVLYRFKRSIEYGLLWKSKNFFQTHSKLVLATYVIRLLLNSTLFVLILFVIAFSFLRIAWVYFCLKMT